MLIETNPKFSNIVNSNRYNEAMLKDGMYFSVDLLFIDTTAQT